MPAVSHPTESARINLRTSPEAKALIERAAAIMGSTVSSFMLQNAYEAARRVVSDNDTLTLSQADFERFIAACENPPEPTEALRKLMALRRMVVRIEPLAARHQRAGFDCGEPALNDFLQRQAGQMERRGFAKTYVALALDGILVVGFVTLSAGQVESQKFPSHLKLPRYPAPTLRIDRLAVDRQQQGLDIGQHLMSFALQLALEFSLQVGLYAVVVDAKNQGVKEFYEALGFVATVDDSLCLYLPMGTLAKLNSG